MSLWRAAVTRVLAHWDISMSDQHLNDSLTLSVSLFRSCSSSCWCSHQTSSTLWIQLSNHASCLPTKLRPQSWPLPLSRRVQPTRIPAVLAGIDTSLGFRKSVSFRKRFVKCVWGCVCVFVAFPISVWAVISVRRPRWRFWTGDWNFETRESTPGEKHPSSQTHTSTWTQPEQRPAQGQLQPRVRAERWHTCLPELWFHTTGAGNSLICVTVSLSSLSLPALFAVLSLTFPRLKRCWIKLVCLLDYCCIPSEI